jgi:medium-chain acyl-[acyl-carrier-protein] hydrolase
MMRSSRPTLHSLSDADFVAELRKLGGTPAPVLDTPELLELVLPTIRADLESTERYEWQPGPPLDCPFVAFGGVSDARVDRPEIEAWRDQTSATFSSHFFPGGHFYLHEHASTLLRLVRQGLPESAIAGP